MVGYNDAMTGGMNFNNQPQPVQFPRNQYNIPNIYNNNMGQQQAFQQPQRSYTQFLKCRPVSSREEAMAFQIDLDGSLWVFPNVANGKIYTKQINNDGSATFSTYTYTQEENPYNPTNYVTKDEFDKVIKAIMAAIHPVNAGTESVANNQNETSNMPMQF